MHFASRSLSAYSFLGRALQWTLLSIAMVTMLPSTLTRASTPPEHYKVGAYVTSIHHIDTANGTFDADLWVWSVGASSARNPVQTMEFVNSESIQRRLQSTIQRGVRYWRQAKIVGRFRQVWDLRDFPFDQQVLDITIDEGADDAAALAYDPDTPNIGYLPDAAPTGWRITGMTIQDGITHYPTNFGDPDGSQGGDYARLKLAITIERASLAPFLNLSAPLYAAFLLCTVSFLLHNEGRALVEARIALLAGALFAVVINMRTVSTMLGNVHNLTVVDRLHIVVLIDIVFATIVTIAAGVARDRGRQFSRRVDYAGCAVLVVSFAAVNTLLITGAVRASSGA